MISYTRTRTHFVYTYRAVIAFRFSNGYKRKTILATSWNKIFATDITLFRHIPWPYYIYLILNPTHPFAEAEKNSNKN